MLLENNPYPQDTRVRNEAESLTAAGFMVTVLAPKVPGQCSSEQINGVRVRRFRIIWAQTSVLSYAMEYLVAHTQLFSRALLGLARGTHVLHFHGPPDTLFLAGVCARLTRRKVVFDLHDSAPELFHAKFGASGTLARALRSAQRGAIRSANHVIVTNQSQLELVRRRGSCSPSSVSVVRNGPRLEDFCEHPPTRSGRLEAPRLVFLGALDSQDGVLQLPELLCERPLAGAKLTIIGDGPLREQIAERCRVTGVAPRVRFTGHVPHEQVVRMLADADIAIDPAPGTELNHGSTMIKVLEYMAAGRPLVAYDLRETRRSAAGAALYAPCGQLSSFARLVAELACDGRRRAEMGSLARERAMALRWEHSARVLEGVYRGLVFG